MISRTRYGAALPLLLAAGLAWRCRCGRARKRRRRKTIRPPRRRPPRRPMPTMPTSTDLEARLEPAQCRCLDAATSPASKARCAAGRGRRRNDVVVEGQGERRLAVSVKQSLSPFWDTRIGADMTVARRADDDVRAAVGKTRQWRQPAAIVRHRLGGDHRPRRRRRSGTRPRSRPASIPDRSRASSAPPSASRCRSSEQYSLTLKNDYNLIQQGIVPVPGIVSHPVAQLRDRPVGEAQHCRHRHQPHRRPDAVDRGRQMAAQGRRRAETVRRRQRLRLDRRNAVRAPPTRASARASSAAGELRRGRSDRRSPRE